MDLGRHAGAFRAVVSLNRVGLSLLLASIKRSCLSIRYIRAMVVRRGRDSTDPLVCPVGREAQVECTVRAHVAGDRRYAMGNTRSLGFHVLWPGHEHHCFLYARPWRIGDSD